MTQMNIDWPTRIVSNPDILAAKPTIKGTRISVELILGCFASQWSFDDILRSYPHITRKDILAALAYARHIASTPQLIEQVTGVAPSAMAEIQFAVEEAPEALSPKGRLEQLHRSGRSTGASHQSARRGALPF